MNKYLYMGIALIILIPLVLFGALAFTSYSTNYHLTELTELIERQEETIELQNREIIFLTNSFFIQCTYTEHLKIELEEHNIEYNLYSEFCKDYLFRFGELDDANFLYENELDFENLLLRGSQKGEYPIDIKELYNDN